MPIASWIDSPEEWDALYLGGERVRLPGLADVSVKLGRKLDSKGPAGSDGANIRDKGYKLAEVEVELTFWLGEQWDAYVQMLGDLLALRVPRAAVPLDIWHPACRSLGVTQVYLEELDSPKNASGLPGAKSVKLKFLQYKPPTARRGTGTVNANAHAPITTDANENASVDPSQSAAQTAPELLMTPIPQASFAQRTPVGYTPNTPGTPDANYSPGPLTSGG